VDSDALAVKGWPSGSGVDGRMHHRPRVMDLAAIGFSGNLVRSAVRASRRTVRYCPLPPLSSFKVT
jgi:hypothetical protein